ncbi:Integral membrane sensor signal transduction histidine kinase [Paraburkholderia piptadeniae]|uniref:histidine kinase n=1 Tax=Paraburkholderia piptadeniae TaxID=1701573 RepID=A0A1N7S7Q2_9BURK|nr:ATP-binding protein [Paraburkholderia piptadeniae]SIT43399.1 Integral membrane sensor signal transduction histidine kinase [Paraburkholderia piptadeniae]
MKLFTKGLLLIALPSAVELALLGVVFDMQEQTAQAVERSSNSRQILYQAASLENPMLRQVARVRAGIVAGDPSFMDRHAAWVDLSERLTRLEEAVADTPEQAERVQQMREAVDSYRQQAMSVAQSLRTGATMKPFATLEGGALPAQAVRFRDELHAFIDEATRLEAEHNATLAQTRTRQQIARVGAVLGSMLIWAATAFAFARGIGRRLNVLASNARRLGSGKPLPAPLAGNDEIAALDAALHRTSALLRAADLNQAALQASLQTRAAELASVNETLHQETQDNELFIYSVSHDLRSPLVNMQGFSKELQVSCDELRATIVDARLPADERKRLADVLDGDVQESLRFVRSSVTRAAAIIDALLRIARAGRLEYHWQRVSVDRAVARAVDALQKRIDEREAVVVVRELPAVWGDPAAIEQMFSQLIANAINFLDPARPGHIEVGALDAADAMHENSAMASPQRTRTYFVRDNGMGIPAAYMPKVFRAFQRLHGNVAPGEGIGLALVRRMVERHGGRVWVESAEGAGSTFFVTLPDQPLRG